MTIQFEPSLARGAVDAVATFRWAIAFHRSGNWNPAERRYGEILLLAPRLLHGLHHLVIVARKRGVPNEALGSSSGTIAIDE